jgi:hypothetical protein
MGRRAPAELGDGVSLLGFDPPPGEITVGDRLQLTLYWQATADPATDYTARLSLVTSTGARVAEARAVPGRADHPTSAWITGDFVRDGRSLLVPAAVPAGEYALQLDLLDAAGAAAQPPVNLSNVTVHAPERNFDLPAVQLPISVTTNGLATLLGCDLDAGGPLTLAPGRPFTITLYWRAEATADIGYIVFVHLLDQAEHIYAQSDRAPAAAARPTTGWLPGEIIHDTHTLDVAPNAPTGPYVLEVGMYNPSSGDRLRVFDAGGADVGDRILLPIPIQVQ